MHEWIVNSEQRLLAFLRDHLKETWSTKDLRWSVEHQRCWVNGQIECFASYKLRKGDRVTLWPTKRPHFSRDPNRILYEDTRLLFYDKPPYIDSPTLAKRLELHLVHRLDRDTSGVIVFAKDLATQKELEALFRTRKVKKEYCARVEGSPRGSGVVIGEMGIASRREGAVRWKIVPKGRGAWSKTHWKVEDGYMICSPVTGRTHQIRVHMQSIGFPILGDSTYGSKKGKKEIFRPLLHARKLEFLDLKIEAPIPQDMR